VNWFFGGLYHAAGMLWLMFWPLVLGLSISAFLQVFVTGRELEKAFGRPGFRSVLLATGFGAATSSCSYAAVATAKTVFSRGGALVPTLAFMFAATNLVIELGILLWMLMGWVFVAAEVLGGLIMIAVMWLLVSLTKPAGLERAARGHLREQRSDSHGREHDHHKENRPAAKRLTFWARLRLRDNWSQIGDAFFMDVKMLWHEVILGVIIAGFLATLVPEGWWQALFLNHGPGGLRFLENAMVGPLIALASFVCSDGNVPVATLLWASGISFGGVVAFIYGDLLIIPLLLLYRKYFGLRAAVFIAGWLYVAMVLAGIAVHLLFDALGWIPQGPRPPAAVSLTVFAWNYTAWLNLSAAAITAGLVALKLRSSGHTGD
jgi:uncharacterized membrane protein YraQ (UPF0718 family)